jgi:hypothetical protein
MTAIEALVFAYRADSQALALDASREYDEATDEADELGELRELDYDELATALTEERWAVCAMLEIIEASGLDFGGIDGQPRCTLPSGKLAATERGLRARRFGPAGAVHRWLRGAEVTYLITQHDGSTFRAERQLVPAEPLRPQ